MKRKRLYLTSKRADAERDGPWPPPLTDVHADLIAVLADAAAEEAKNEGKATRPPKRR